MKLSEVRDGTVVSVVDIFGEEDIRRRVFELKILPKTCLVVVKNNEKSYVVVETDNGKFGIPYDLADKIEVKVIGVTVKEK